MIQYLKHADSSLEQENRRIRDTVESMLIKIRAEGEPAVRAYAKEFDGWEGDFILSDEEKMLLLLQVGTGQTEDIRMAHSQVKKFADAQRASISEFELETMPGVKLSQRIVPVQSAGCYIPGGRYAYIASALMSVTTAKAAGVPCVIAACPPMGDSIAPAVALALHIAGADIILEMGGVQAIATMAFGLFGLPKVDILVGPGNTYVAEAKRQLFGETGIDLFAGPTEIAVIADKTADPMTVAIDLASQAEHGPDSPAWLITNSRDLGETVGRILPLIAADMPSGDVVLKAWKNNGEIILCDTREEMCETSDSVAAEHLQVIAEDTDWWKHRLKNYGSLFLGEGSTVAHGDKCSGTNHILPTRKAARYTGGLNVMKFLKILTTQEISPEGNRMMGEIASRISRLEGMDGHARACDWRLRKYYPDEKWGFEVSDQKRYE